MRFYSWELAEFRPISFSNTYGLHLLKTDILVLDINGRAHWLNQQRTLNLKEHLGEEDRNHEDFDIELVASDSFAVESSSAEGSAKTRAEEAVFLATCWIVYDHLFAPERQFAALFHISLRSFDVKLAAKFNLQTVPTFTRLTTNPPINEEDDKLYWLVFAYSQCNCAYAVDTHSARVHSVEQIGDIFPFLDMKDMPGSVIRTHCCIIGHHRLSLVGYDTGYVIASVCLMDSGIIIDRKSLKFDGPISVLKVIDTKSEPENGDLKADAKRITVLISSTIGPVTIWELRLQDDLLVWESGGGFLLESELYDTITCAAVQPDQAEAGDGGLILIGTYGELLLIYDLREVCGEQRGGAGGCEIAPIHTVSIAAPILAIAPHGTRLLVLSSKGLHVLSPTTFGGMAAVEENENNQAGEGDVATANNTVALPS